ncbi:hypothetical protein CEXT_220381 [Caerostris extrusa]|uniref:Uncharacterized protein n=1 Tax=Caerostris extrusa TaxID=172846 RepID=A0AAV4TXZ6_CAEEX|nr:hypothetical protein CEXT_220381 [Caerostris extrusa]
MPFEHNGPRFSECLIFARPLSIHLCDCSAILSLVSDQIKSFPNGNASMHALALPLGRQRKEIVVSNPFVDCDMHRVFWFCTLNKAERNEPAYKEL